MRVHIHISELERYTVGETAALVGLFLLVTAAWILAAGIQW